MLTTTAAPRGRSRPRYSHTRCPSRPALQIVLLCCVAGIAAPACWGADSVTVDVAGGLPVLLVDDQPVPPHMHFNTSWDAAVVSDGLARAFAAGGVHLNQFDVNLDWQADYDQITPEIDAKRYAGLDKRLRALVEIDSKALVLLRVHMHPPVPWGKEHPAEILAFEDGTPITASKWSAATSYASEVWREQAGTRLTALIRHLQHTNLEDHVLGYLPFAGQTGEWNFFRQTKGDLPGARWAKLANMSVDHSPAMQRAFRQFLERKYRQPEALATAWGDPQVTFPTASAPTEAEVYAALPAQLNDPQACARVVDYFTCLAQQLSDSLLHFAACAKASSPQRICGAFFGEYLFAAIGGNREILRTGHGMLERVLSCPDIDFIVTPNCYQSTAPGRHSPSMTIVGSALRRGKLVWYEYDQPTHLVRSRKGLKDMSHTRALMRRAFGYALCGNLGLWWWDQESRCTNAVAEGVWFRGPEVRAEFALYQRVWRQALRRDRASISQIAVVYDPSSCLYQRPAWKDFTRALIFDQVDALGKLGAPYDILLLSDIQDARPYKLYIIWNAFYLDDAQRQALRQVTRRPGTTTLWLYAPGYLGPGGCSTQAVADLVGMQMAQAPEGTLARANTLPHEAFAGLDPLQFGPDTAITPLLGIIGDATPLAAFEQAMDLGAAALREDRDWRTVYCATAPVPAAFLRAIARRAGGHQYTGGDDIIYANASYLALHTNTAGLKVISLPHPATVRDAFTAEVIATGATQFEVQSAGPQTHLFAIDRL